jgi:thiol-disulfide isomerase/thioredoxin
MHANLFTKIRIILFSALIFYAPQLNSKTGTAENFPVYNLNGERFIFYKLLDRLADDGVMIVNFTSVTCLPCKKELPELLKIVNEKGQPDKVNLMCIYAEDAVKAKKSADALGVTSFTYTDIFGNIQKLYGVKNYPVTFLINKKRKIIGRYTGYKQSNMEQIKKIIQ